MEAAEPPNSPALGPGAQTDRPGQVVRFILVASGLSALWFLLNEGDPESWIVGAPSILLGAWLACLLPSPPRWGLSPLGALRFVPFFLWQSLVGGLDVAVRALRPSLPIVPTFLSYDTRLPPGPARVFFFDAITLLPGTLSAELEGDRVIVHALDGDASPQEGIEDLERRVARLFRLELGPT